MGQYYDEKAFTQVIEKGVEDIDFDKFCFDFFCLMNKKYLLISIERMENFVKQVYSHVTQIAKGKVTFIDELEIIPISDMFYNQEPSPGQKLRVLKNNKS